MKQILLLRLALIFLASLLFTSAAFAQTTHRKLDGFCELGNRTVTVSGNTSTTKVQQSMPSCTVTVFIAGTATPASICSDNSGPTCTPKPNPFTADSSGYWAFFAASAQYDVQFTGGTSPNTFPSPFVRSFLTVPSPFTGATAVTNNGVSTDNAIARFDGTTGLLIQNSTVILGDTGNITGVGTLNNHTIPGGADTFTLNAASQTLTNKLFVSPSNVLGGVGVAIGGDGTGDIWYRNAGGIFTRLAIGSSGQVLTVAGGLPSWATGSSPPFSDSTSIIQGSSDATKLLRFEIDGFTTGNTRILTPPDASIVLAGTNFLNAWADGVKQTFNPDGTNAGINVGQHTTDPSSPTNGDCYYNSVASELRCRINGVWIALGAGGGGGGTPGGSNGNIQYRVNASTFGGMTGSVVSTIGEVTFQNAARTSGSASAFSVIASPDTTLAADTESLFGRFLGVTRQFTSGGGTFSSQREWLFGAPTYAFTSADTITTAATLAISAGPSAGTNATITNSYALWIQAGTILVGTPNSSLGAVRFSAAADADTTTIQSGDTPASSVTIKLPADNPAANDFLKVTSFGGGVAVLEWAPGGASGCSPAGVTGDYLMDNGAGGCSSSVTRETNGRINAVPTAASSGSVNYYRFITPADTNMTASTESIGMVFGGSSAAPPASVTRQFATGALTTQREYLFTHPTYAFVGASTLTNAATVAISNAPAQGTNATITNAYALWAQAGNTRLDGILMVNVNSVANQFYVVSSGDAIIAARIDGTASATTDLLQIRRGSSSVFTIASRGTIIQSPVAVTTGTAFQAYLLTGASHTGLTNSESTDIDFSLDRTVTFSGGGGAIGTQRAFLIGNPTYAASAAQTITDAATVAIENSPLAGTNITITRSHALWIQQGSTMFGTPSSTTGSIKFAVSGDADITTIQAGDTPASSVTYKWPADDPAATQVLTVTSFSGGVAVLEWAAGGGGSGCTVSGSQGDYQINNGAGGCAAGVITQGTNGRVIGSPTNTSSGALSYFRIVTPADTAQTADAEMLGIVLGGSSASPPATVTRQGADGTTIATQREVLVTHPTYGYVGATTVTTAATFAISNAPVAGTNATITNPYALLIQAGNVGLDTATQVTWNHDTSLIRGNPRNADLRGPGTHTGESCFRAYGSFVSSTQYRRLKLCSVNFGAFIGTEQQNETDTNITFQIGANSYGALNTDGTWNFGNGSSASAQVHAISQSTSRIGLRVDSATNSTVDTVAFNPNVDDTSTVANVFSINGSSNGTAANGFGNAWSINLEASTGTVLGASQFSVNWTNATTANATSDYSIALMDNAVGGEKFRLRANGQILYQGLKRATADLTKTSSTTFSDITGLSVNLVTGRTYLVKAIVYYNMTSATGGGAKLTLTGTATASAALGSGHAIDTGTSGFFITTSGRRATAIDGSANYVLVVAATASSGGTAYIEATIVCNGSGNLRVQGAQETSNANTTTFLTNSTMEVWEVSN